MAASAAELKAANAALAEANKREAQIMGMAKAKDAAVAKFVEGWTKQQLAKISKSMKPKKKKRKKAKAK